MNPGLQIDDIEERFFVHGRMEILAQLHDLIYRQEAVRIDFGAGESIFTRLLEARDQSLIFEAGADAAANGRLAAAPACVFCASPDGIRVQFACGQAQPLAWGDAAAFSVALPTRLARLQRQESFRLKVASKQAPRVTLLASDGAPLGEWPLRDLSVGGLAVAVNSQAELALAPRVARVRLALPGHGQIDCAACLRHATALTLAEGKFAYRIGLGFAGLPEAMRVAIQRYIAAIEQSRRGAKPQGAGN